jgi:hypothetical protein
VDIFKALKALHEERQKLDEVITVLEKLQINNKERSDAFPLKPVPRRGRKSMDEEARREVSRRMKSYWARRRQVRTAAGEARESSSE